MNQNQNQNQRYEARVGFKSGIHAVWHEPGYECRMAFPGACTPQNPASEVSFVFSKVSTYSRALL